MLSIARTRCLNATEMAVIGVVALSLAGVMSSAALAQGSDDEPLWAYGVAPEGSPPNPRPQIEGSEVFSLPGADGSFTYDEIQARFGPADWYPADHPTMPDIVARGREPDIWACSQCHYPNGLGRPENAMLAGLPRDYIVQQLHELKDGLRETAVRMFGSNLMVQIAQALTDEEIEQAADYFSSMAASPWVRVVESEEAPRTRLSFGLHVPITGEGAGIEPFDGRIVEVPEKPENTEIMRDPKSAFIAYVPLGSIERGEQLAATGGEGTTIQCNTCHGPNLNNGLPIAPPIAGRSPSYIVRQLYDFRQGTRHGTQAVLMQPVVANLSVENMIDLAAYVASLPPSAP